MSCSLSLSDFNTLFQQLKKGESQTIPTTPHPFLIAYLLHHLDPIGPYILVSLDKKLLTNTQEALRFFEPEQKVFSLEDTTNPWQEGLNISHLKEHCHLQILAHALQAKKTDVFMLNPQNLIHKVPHPDLLKNKIIYLKKGDLLPLDFTNTLKELGYTSREYVEQIGEFSLRGCVLDIFCPLSQFPVRIELIGDEIIMLKSFNIRTQISFTPVEEVQISPVQQWCLYDLKETYNKMKQIIQTRTHLKQRFFPFWQWSRFLSEKNISLYENSDNATAHTPEKNIFSAQQKDIYESLKNWRACFFYPSSTSILNYFSNPLIWHLDEPHFLQNTLLSWKTEVQKNNTKNENNVYPVFLDRYLLDQKKIQNKEVIFNTLTPDTHSNTVFAVSPNTNFFKSPQWTKQIKKQREQGFLVFIAAGKKHIKQKLTLELTAIGIIVKTEEPWFLMTDLQQTNHKVVHLISSFTGKNFIWLGGQIIFLQADTAISTKYLSQKVSKKTLLPIENTQTAQIKFSELESGDLIVHKQYGIGCFQKLKVLNFHSKDNEFLVLEYQSGNLLYVPVYALHQVQKYSGPTLTKVKNLLDTLGDKKWLNTKEKVRKRIQDMTLELMNLYTKRSCLKRKKFNVGTEDFDKFESEFPFPETPDQQKAIDCILHDLTAKDTPMDRLICGDTGFGKTEVAIRAAFKVIEDGFQVCFIAPTTILSFQHFERLKERFNTWPVRIKLLNRFTPAPERKKTLQEIKEGTVDILIGTHRILSKDIYFKHLGLLIIDEEHLFGVKSKEKIKNWYSLIDTISLSATPIPRSLSMSMAGLRDISTILTPPLNRKPINTFITPFKESLIKEIVLKEINRKGQIIFIHNRISTIFEIEDTLKKLLPSVRIRTAHGKMKDLQQKVVLDFFQEKFDLLLCTTIVESGMDFPKANTLFINQAELFGLSQLHQLRGRIGRSDKNSYCYLFINAHKKISEKALERLKIIQENNQPGAGMRIAQYDLEMRGAGELMGEEQSGFLQDIGYEMYFEFLHENIALLKDNNNVCVPEPDLQFKLEAFIPRTYIPHEKARLIFYKRLASTQIEEELKQIKEELTDFAGPLPLQTENLILISYCRVWAKKLHIRELTHKSPWLYINLANTTPLSVPRILKLLDQKVCEWKNQNTLKFYLKQDNILGILHLLKTLVLQK